MVDVSQRSELSLLDHDALARAVGSILDRHEEIQDWTILYTQRELGMRYPGIDFSTASVYGQINVYSVTTKSERYERSYWTRTAAGNGIGGRKAPVPYGS